MSAAARRWRNGAAKQAYLRALQDDDGTGSIGLYADALFRASDGGLRVVVPMSRVEADSFDKRQRVAVLTIKRKNGIASVVTVPDGRPPQKIAAMIMNWWREKEAT